MSAGANNVAKISSGFKVGGKVLGAAGGALSIGLGVYDLCSDPNEKCKACDGHMTQEFCRRQCIACWTEEDNCVISLNSNRSTNDKYCALICEGCYTGGAFDGRTRDCYICHKTSNLIPVHKELNNVHPALKTSATKKTGAGLGIASGILAIPAIFLTGPIGIGVAVTSIAVGAGSAGTQLLADNDPNCKSCSNDVKTEGCKSVCRTCGEIGDKNTGHEKKCSWICQPCNS